MRLRALSQAAMGCVAVLVVLGGGCRSPYYADQGALLGGLAGAATGAAIGDHNDATAAGAVIGGAVGAFGGAAIGSSIDADLARSQAIIEQRVGRQMRGAVTVQDAITLSRAGVSPDVIQTHIRANGVAQIPSTADVIAMTKQGVPESVILALQQSASAPVRTAVVPRRSAQVYIGPAYYHRRHYHDYYGPPPWYGPPVPCPW